MTTPLGLPKVSGFSILRNGVKFDYPFRESILSALPLVDEFVVALGQSDDGTRDALEQLAQEQPKLKIIESPWPLDNPEKMRGGQILSEQTNIALAATSPDTEWALYLQADEVLSEEDYFEVRQALARAATNPQVEGLCFDYVHFYGSFDVVQETRGSYRREVRLIRKLPTLRSLGDAQSFRHTDGRKPNVIRAQARVFHYGWVRDPSKMREKTFHMDQLYHGAPSAQDAAEMRPHTGDNYRYQKHWGLRKFQGRHPQVMAERIASRGWHWDLANSPMKFSRRDVKRVILDLFERASGIRLFEYRCYRLLGDRSLRR